MSSPEQLDQLMQVVEPRLWLALSAGTLLLVAAGVWSFTGSIPTRVHATGVLIRTGGVYDVAAPSSGVVADVAVRPGDPVREGQVVATIEQPALLDELASARARLEEQEQRHQSLTLFVAKEETLDAAVLRRQRDVVVQSLDAAHEEMQWLEAKAEGQRALLSEGLIRQEDLLATEQRASAAGIRAEQLQGELKQLDLNHLAESARRSRELVQSENQLAALERDVQRLEEALREATQVRSTHSGRILEVMADIGSISQRGQPLMRLDRIAREMDDLEAVVYIPAQYGKRVRTGMTVQVSPANVKREEHGYMIGQVRAASEFPATQEAMHRTLKNQNLVQILSGGGAPYEAFVILQSDSASPNGHAWSGRPPGIPIHSGTLCTATITTHRRRPIDLVVPFLRRTVGL